MPQFRVGANVGAVGGCKRDEMAAEGIELGAEGGELLGCQRGGEAVVRCGGGCVALEAG